MHVHDCACLTCLPIWTQVPTQLPITHCIVCRYYLDYVCVILTTSGFQTLSSSCDEVRLVVYRVQMGLQKKTQSIVAHINSQKKRLGTFTCVNNQSLESQPMFHTLSLIITYIVELIQQNPSKFLHESSKKSPVESDTTHEEVLFLTWSVLSPSPWRHNCHPNVGNFITHLTLPFFVQCDDPQEMIQWKQLSRTCKM